MSSTQPCSTISSSTSSTGSSRSRREASAMRKWYPLSLVTILVALSAVVYSRMPERMAIHFTLDGTPNGWAPRWEGLFLLPAIILVVWGVMFAAPKLDPRRENYERMQPAYGITVYAVLTFLAVAQ